MNNQIRELSPTRQDGEADKGVPACVHTELGEDELSQVSGGKGSSIALMCASGKHIANAKIIV